MKKTSSPQKTKRSLIPFKFSTHFLAGFAVGVILVILGFEGYLTYTSSKELPPTNGGVTKCYNSSCKQCLNTCDETFNACSTPECNKNQPCKMGCLLTRGGCHQRCYDAQPAPVKSCGQSCDDAYERCAGNGWCLDDYGNMDQRCVDDCNNQRTSCVDNCNK